MRLVPVLDLLDGHAVHALRGDRKNYRPVRSVLCASSDPLDLARAFRDRLGLREIYIADLDSIQGFGRERHRDLIRSLCREPGADIILDAGVADRPCAFEWLELGAGRVVIGSETLDSMESLADLSGGIDPHRRIFSLDLRAGAILSRCPEFAALDPMEALDRLQRCGWRDVLLLDLARVGSRAGPALEWIAQARAAFPGLRLWVGGGIADCEDLEILQSMRIEAALLATALHRGTIGAREIQSLHDGPDRQERN